MSKYRITAVVESVFGDCPAVVGDYLTQGDPDRADWGATVETVTPLLTAEEALAEIDRELTLSSTPIDIYERVTAVLRQWKASQ